MNPSVNKTLSDKQIFLIITVGGTADPIIESIKEYKPKKVLFICSRDSQKKFQEDLKRKSDLCIDLKQDWKYNPYSEKENLSSAGKRLSAEDSFKKTVQSVFSYLEIHNIEDPLILEDPENIGKTLKQIKDKVESEHKKWIKNSDDYLSVVDITGGTKCMSASLALSAHKWEKCVFSYVGGERDKGNTGIVKSGSEKIIKKYNPYKLLGYQSIEDAVLLFKNYNYSAACDVLERTFENMKSPPDGEEVAPTLKEEFCQAKKWMEAYKDWDDFKHEKARSVLKKLQNKHLNNLESTFSKHEGIDVRKSLSISIEYLDRLLSPKERKETSLSGDSGKQGERVSPSKQKSKNTGSIKNSPYLIFDLIVNAERKAAQGRFDDAIARLYRSVEAMAQYRLQTKYGIVNSEKVPYENLTPELQKKHKKPEPVIDLQNNSKSSLEKQKKPNTVKLALRDCWLFLIEKNDPFGKKFKDLRLAAEDIFFSSTGESLGKEPPLSQLSTKDPEKPKGEEAEKQNRYNPLSKRNKSILAHGFHPLSKQDYENLLQSTRKLFEFLEQDLYKKKIFDFNKGENNKPYFPKLKNRD